MKTIHKTLLEAIQQAKPGTCDARLEGLLGRLRTNRSVKVMIVVAALWLAGCGNSAEESNPAQGQNDSKDGDDVATENSDNPGGAQEKIFSNKVEFSAENIEKAGNTAAFSLLKEALEYTEHSRDFGYLGDEELKEASYEAFDIEEENLPQDTGVESQLLTSHKEISEDIAQFKDIPEGTKEPLVSLYLNSYTGEAFPYKEFIVEIAPAGSLAEGEENERILLTLNTSRDFDLPEDKGQSRKMINQLDQGEISSIKPLWIETKNGEKDFSWYTEAFGPEENPQKVVEGLNDIWNNKLPEILEESPRQLSLVKKLPKETENTPTVDAAGEDQYQSEAGGQEISDTDSPELDGSAEKREQYLDNSARELAAGIIDKLAEEDDYFFINAGEQAPEEISYADENKGAYTNHSLDALETDVKITVIQNTQDVESSDMLDVHIETVEDEHVIISFNLEEGFDISNYTLEELSDLVKNDTEALEMDGLFSSEEYEERESLYLVEDAEGVTGSDIAAEVTDSDIEAAVDKARSLLEEEFGVNLPG